MDKCLENMAAGDFSKTVEFLKYSGYEALFLMEKYGSIASGKVFLGSDMLYSKFIK